MTTRSVDLTLIPLAWNPLGVQNKIKGGAIATRSSRDAALYSQMQVISHGRRMVCRAGLDGQPSLLVLDGTNPSSGATQVYPLGDAQRVMARGRCRLTPGYHLRVVAVMLPSGPSQFFSGSNYLEDASKPPPHILVTAVYDNGSITTTKTIKLTPKVSTETRKALPAAAGGAWDVLEELEGSLVPDEIVDGDPDWVEHVIVDVTITGVGALRPIDIEVHETPSDATHDDTHREGTIPLAKPTVSTIYPLTGIEPTTDDRYGAHQANKTMEDQRQIWGPAIAFWSCWSEDVATITDTEGTAASFTATSFRSLGDTAITSYATGNPGWSVSSGGYARGLEQSGLLELRDVNGTIPVTVRVWARMTNAAHVGTVRVQSAGYAYRDITVTGSTSFAWYSALAWIRVPVHASLDSLLQIFGKVAGGGQTLEMRYASVEYGGHYETSE